LLTQRGELAASRGCGTAERTFNVTWYSRMWSDTDRTGVPEDERGCFKSFISPPRAELFSMGDNLRPVEKRVKWGITRSCGVLLKEH
jgi:hypothetical protein